MPVCVAIGCRNYSGQGKTMKNVPSEPSLRKIWLENIGRKDWEPTKNSCLCEDHFEDSQFEPIVIDGKRKLRKGAIPTIFDRSLTMKRKPPGNRYTSSPKIIKLSNSVLNEIEKKAPEIIKVTSCDNVNKDVLNNSKENDNQYILPNSVDILDVERTSNPDDVYVKYPLEIEDKVSNHLNVLFHSKQFTDSDENHVNDDQFVDNYVSKVTANDMSLQKNMQWRVRSSRVSPKKLAMHMSPNNYDSSNDYEDDKKDFDVNCSIIEGDIDIEESSVSEESAELCTLREENQKLKEDLTNAMLKIEDLKNRLSRCISTKSKLRKEFLKPLAIYGSFLNDDQIEVLRRNRPRSSQWSGETLKNALKLRITCGELGYKELLKQKYPLPGLRTLYRKVNHFDICGININEILRGDVGNERKKECLLLVDSLTITPEDEYGLENDF